MRTLIVLLVVLLAGCVCKRPHYPSVVTKIVEKPMPVPEWVREQPVPQPVDGTVQARVVSHDRRGALIEYYHCVFRLLRKVQHNEVVDPNDCPLP